MPSSDLNVASSFSYDKDKDTTDVKCYIKEIQPQTTNDQCVICHEAVDQHYLDCVICKFKFHYLCSVLPPYQISNFKTSSCWYTCEHCTKEKPEIIQAIEKERKAKWGKREDQWCSWSRIKRNIRCQATYHRYSDYGQNRPIRNHIGSYVERVVPSCK